MSPQAAVGSPIAGHPVLEMEMTVGMEAAGRSTLAAGSDRDFIRGSGTYRKRKGYHRLSL